MERTPRPFERKWTLRWNGHAGWRAPLTNALLADVLSDTPHDYRDSYYRDTPKRG